MTVHFRLTAPEPPERELQQAIVEKLDLLLMPSTFWFSAAIGACQLSRQQAAALNRAGVRRGLPDLFFVHQGRLYGIELKVRGGQLSKTRVVRTRRGSPRILVGQVDRFAELEAAGMPPIAICRSADEVIAQITRWGIPVRGRAALSPSGGWGAQSYRESP
jgi:hypothetical protein